MFSKENINIHPQPNPRPLWQLLLAEQTGQLPPLTCEEYQALLEFLGDLASEGYNPGPTLRWLGHCLAQMRKCGLDILSCPLPISPLHHGISVHRQK
jgi:hypothetical protein